MVHTWRKDRQTTLELCTFTTYTSCTTSRNAQNHPQAIATVDKGGLQAKPEHKRHAAHAALLTGPAAGKGVAENHNSLAALVLPLHHLQPAAGRRRSQEQSMQTECDLDPTRYMYVCSAPERCRAIEAKCRAGHSRATLTARLPPVLGLQGLMPGRRIAGAYTAPSMAVYLHIHQANLPGRPLL
jgi:hypothetical protein